MQTLLQDLRHALRHLRKAPGFTATAVLTLALGIGATTAIFTLVYDVLLSPLPYRHPEQLVVLQEEVAEFRDIYPTLPVNATHFLSWQHNSHSFQSIAIMEQASMPLGTGGHPRQVDVLSATAGLFSVLESAPQLGRAFTPGEATSGHDRVVLLMNSLWRRQFQSDPHILGKTVTLNGFPYSVIGVMPPSFHLPLMQGFDRAKPVEALVPLAFSKDRLEERMGDFNYFGLGRLKPGVSVPQASAEINALQHAFSATLSAEEKGTLSAVLTPFQQALVGDNRTPLLILLAAVAGLLLVGCVNIANLLLARSAGRRQQMAVAAALGASRAQMLRMSLRETAVLAAFGGALGLLLAAALVPLMQHFLPPALDFRGALHLDWAGAACALLLTLAATLLAGAAPAWFGARTQPHEVLHSESRLATESRASKRLRGLLVALEVAVSVALVLMTVLLSTSMVRLLHTDPGFQPDRLLSANIDLPRKSYDSLPQRTAFYKQALDRLRQLPGLEQAGLISQLPLVGDQWIDMIRVPGDPRPIMQLPSEHFRWMSPGYLEAMHLPLVAGRSLTASDDGKPVAILSQLTARTLWPGLDPIGRQFSRAGQTEAPFTVIGVVKNARTLSLAKPDPMMVYVPFWYRSDSTGALLVRTRQDPSAMADSMRKAIWSVDPEVSVPLVRSLGVVIADSVANRRFILDLLLLFAISALLLAGLGVYGVVTYSVVQRHREIGLRLALGAQKAGIYRLILRDGLRPVLLGALAGVGVALTLARLTQTLLSPLLFAVSPYNPAVVLAALSVLITVGAAACLLPARRAASVDPMQALRAE